MIIRLFWMRSPRGTCCTSSIRDLPHRDYAPLLRYVQYVADKDNILMCFVPSPTRINKWNVYIQFIVWDAQVRDIPPDATRGRTFALLVWKYSAGVRLSIISLYGYQYILTQLDAAMVPEIRFPHIRNPQLKGIACEHCVSGVENIGFSSSETWLKRSSSNGNITHKLARFRSSQIVASW